MHRQTRIWLVPQALVAIVLGVGATLVVLAVGRVVTVAALLVLFSLVSFALLGIARVVAVNQRFRFRRWRFGRGSGLRGPDDGGWGGGDGGSGVREPRRPRWPFRPPRAAAAEPEQTTHAL